MLEFICELIFEGIEEISTNRKIRKWVRYPLILLVTLFYLAVIGFMFLLGIKAASTKDYIIAIVFFSLALFFFIGTILKFRKMYFSKKQKNNHVEKENQLKI